MYLFDSYVRLNESEDAIDVFDVNWDEKSKEESELAELFVSYVREEYGASYDIYSINTDKAKAYEDYKKDIETFLEWGPDDTFILNLVKVPVDTTINDRLQKLAKTDIDSKTEDDLEFLEKVLEQSKEAERIFLIDSMSVVDSIAEIYAKEAGLNYESAHEKILEDDALFKKYISKYTSRAIW